MDLKLKGKSVIVVASSKGLGKATAHEFAEEGAYVLLTSRSEVDLQQAVEEIKEKTANDQVRYQVCDITKEEQVKGLVQAAIEWNGGVDVLINNSGGPPAGTFDSFTDEDWQNAFELNLLSYVRLIREVLPSMRKRGEGRIVNIASSSIKESLDDLLLSNTFRAGIVGLSKSLAREFASEHILVNTVGPGRIATDRVSHLDEVRAENLGISKEEVEQEAANLIPMGRYGKPEEFAKAIVFLASGANTYITGQTLVVDGGLVKAL